MTSLNPTVSLRGLAADLTAAFDVPPEAPPLSPSRRVYDPLVQSSSLSLRAISPSPPLTSSPRLPWAMHSSPLLQRASAAGVPSPAPGSASKSTYNVVQLLEKELATERIERREEVAFITKMHEKEVEVWKSRSQVTSQRLADERKIFERETAGLDSKLAIALERARLYEDRAVALEDEVVLRGASLEESRASILSSEAAAVETLRAQLVECNVEREQSKQEHDRLSAVLHRTQQNSEESTKAHQREELAAVCGSEASKQALKSLESTVVTLQQQESQALSQLRLQESQGLARAEEKVAAQHSQVCLYEGLHKEALCTGSEQQLEAAACARQVVAAHDVEKARLESQVVELRVSFTEIGERSTAALQLTKHEHRAEVTKLQARASELDEEKTVVLSSVDRLCSTHTLAEQSWQLQLQEKSKRLDDMRDDRKDMDAQRDHALQQETEAATLRRIEVTWLRTELEEVRNRSSRDMDDLLQQRTRENDHWEVWEAAAVEEMRVHAVQFREMESRLSEADVEHVKLRASLAVVEKEEAQSHSALELLRPELAVCEARAMQSEMNWASRSREVCSAHEALQEELRKELLVEVGQTEKWKAQGEAVSQRARGELEESEAARLQLSQSLAQLRGESQQLLCAYQIQQKRVCQLDGTMRQHLQLLDREVSDLCGLRQAFAAAEPDMGGPCFPDSLNTLLFHSPARPTSQAGLLSPSLL